MGYAVRISHYRRFKVPSMRNGRLSLKTVLRNDNANRYPLRELLPKGGLTTITVTDPETKVEFYGKATCHTKENYNKKRGIEKCLERVIYLMRVCDGKDGFEFKLK